MYIHFDASKDKRPCLADGNHCENSIIPKMEKLPIGKYRWPDGLYRVFFLTGTPPKSSKYEKVNLG